MNKMNVGNLVMFKPEGQYAKWFGGQLGVVESVSYAADGNLHCRVKWLTPVKYFDKTTQYSDFAASKFEVYNEAG